MSSNKRKKILLSLGLFASLMASYFIYEFVMYVSTDNAQVEAPSVMLAPRISGYVVAVHVTEGQKVKKGEVLVEIDDRDFKNTLIQVRGELASIQSQRVDSEKNFKRLSSLYSTGAVSQQQYDTASANFSQIRARHDAVSATVSQAELNLENTKIKAPSDGFVARKSVEVGQLASPGVPLIGFVGATERWITANFKETDLGKIKVGSKVDIEVDALADRNFHGTVDSVSSATGATFTLLPPDNATGNFTKVVQRVPVKIKFSDLTDKDIEVLRAGLSALVKVHKR